MLLHFLFINSYVYKYTFTIFFSGKTVGFISPCLPHKGYILYTVYQETSYMNT